MTLQMIEFLCEYLRTKLDKNDDGGIVLTLKDVAFLCANLGNRLRRGQTFDRLKAGNMLLQAALAADAAANIIQPGYLPVDNPPAKKRGVYGECSGTSERDHRGNA